MERNRGTTVAIVAALIIAVISLGVAFAAFSTTLTINGTATVESSNWKIHFTKTSGGSDPGSTGVAISPTTSNLNGFTTTATGSGTLKTADFTWTGTLKTPGDRIVFPFFIRNAGTYNAKITSINTPTISCTKNSTAETTVCGNITYGVYTDENGKTRLPLNDTLASGASKQVYVIVTLNKDMTAAQLPDANVTVNPTTISITYSQN